MKGGATCATALIALALTGCGPAAEAGNTAGPAKPAAPTGAQMAVTITGNGLLSDGVSGDETAASCAAFRLTPAQVGDYFAHGETVDARAYTHDLDMSRCYAAGSVRLPGGETGTWTIDQARRGALTLGAGKIRYMVCRACPAPPFFEEDGE